MEVRDNAALNEEHKDNSDLNNWIGWLQARIPSLKESVNIYWLKQAMEGYKESMSSTEAGFSIEKAKSSMSLISAANSMFGQKKEIQTGKAEQGVLTFEEYIKTIPETTSPIYLTGEVDKLYSIIESFACMRVTEAKKEWEQKEMSNTEEIDKLSAENHLKRWMVTKKQPYPGAVMSDFVLDLMDEFASMRVEQAEKEWEAEKQELESDIKWLKSILTP